MGRSIESASAHTGMSVGQTSTVTIATTKHSKPMIAYQLSGTSGYARISVICTSSFSIGMRLTPLYIVRPWYRTVWTRSAVDSANARR